MFIAFHITLNVMLDDKPKDVISRLGTYLQREREKAGFKQPEIAGKASITIQQLSRIENGQSGTKRKTLDAICEAIGIDKFQAYKIAGLVREEMVALVDLSSAPNRQRLLICYDALPPDRQRDLLDQAENLYQRYGVPEIAAPKEKAA